MKPKNGIPSQRERYGGAPHRRVTLGEVPRIPITVEGDDMTDTVRTRVAIIGAGPAGLLLAASAREPPASSRRDRPAHA